MKSSKTKTAVKAEPIQTAFGNLYPSLTTDTAGGKAITQGSMFMQIHAGEITTEHEGKKVKISVGSGLNGATILLANARSFVLDLERFTRDAIDNGLLAETLDFNRAS